MKQKKFKLFIYKFATPLTVPLQGSIKTIDLSHFDILIEDEDGVWVKSEGEEWHLSTFSSEFMKVNCATSTDSSKIFSVPEYYFNH